MISKLKKMWYGWRFKRDEVLRGLDADRFQLRMYIKSLERDLERVMKDRGVQMRDLHYLVGAVETKVEGETRYQTALRYIREAERKSSQAGQKTEAPGDE